MRGAAQFLAIALGMTVALTPVRGQAQVDDTTRAAARELGSEGIELYDAGDYAGALDRLTRAHELINLTTTGLWRARSLEKLGRLVEASEQLRAVTRMALDGDAQPIHRDAKEEAASDLAAIQPRIASLVIRLDAPDDATVTLDGRELPRALIGVSQPIDPGEHVVVVRAGGRERKEKLSLSEGEARELPLSLADGGVAPGPSPEPSPVPDGPDDGPDRPSEGDGSVLEPIGWTAVAVGAAGLVVGAVTGGLAVAKKSDLDTACPGGACEPEFHGDVDSFETLRTTSTAMFVVGGVLAGTGITLVIAAAVSSDDGQAHITPIVAPGGGGLMWHGSF